MTREEAIKRLKDGAPFSDLLDVEWEKAINMAIKALEQKEKVAEWYEENGCEGACEGYMSAGVICSQCGEVFCGYIGYNFCPNCGARMIEPQESEDKE